MPQELRYLLFETEEVRSAIVRFLLTRRPRQRAANVRSVSLFASRDGVVAEVRVAGNPPGVQRLENDDLVIAMLDLCRCSRIPLPRLSVKSLELSDGRLVMVTGMNAVSTMPRLVNGQLKYAEWALRSAYPNGS